MRASSPTPTRFKVQRRPRVPDVMMPNQRCVRRSSASLCSGWFLAVFALPSILSLSYAKMFAFGKSGLHRAVNPLAMQSIRSFWEKENCVMCALNNLYQYRIPQGSIGAQRLFYCRCLFSPPCILYVLDQRLRKMLCAFPTCVNMYLWIKCGLYPGIISMFLRRMFYKCAVESEINVHQIRRSFCIDSGNVYLASR